MLTPGKRPKLSTGDFHPTRSRPSLGVLQRRTAWRVYEMENQTAVPADVGRSPTDESPSYFAYMSHFDSLPPHHAHRFVHDNGCLFRDLGSSLLVWPRHQHHHAVRDTALETTAGPRVLRIRSDIRSLANGTPDKRANLPNTEMGLDADRILVLLLYLVHDRFADLLVYSYYST